MRPKAHPSQHKPLQRKAYHYAAYAFWAMLVLWVLLSYPSSGRDAATLRNPAELRPHSHATDTRVKVQGKGGSGGGSVTGSTLGAGADTSTDRKGFHEIDEDGSIAEWDLEGSSTEGEIAKDDDSQQQQTQDKQQLEHVATVGGGKVGGGTSNSADPPGRVYSSCTIYAVRNGSGRLAKYYYKFSNVRVTKKVLYFFMPPGMKKPEELWVDFISGNSTTPALPTVIVIKGEVQRQKWFYLPIRYTTVPSNCAAWTNKPTYFMQVRYSYNIWHTWNEGLMGAFQTLREQGLLPLVQVDEAGNMREVTEGLSPQCPLIFDPALNTTREEDTCVQRLGVVKGTHCDAKNQPWCRPGVVSYRRFDGPIILPYTAASVMNRWAQVYDAMTTDIRDFSLVDGHCFKSFIVGKTNTLNYYQIMNQTLPGNEFVHERVEAMAVFKHFVSTAQREFVTAEKAKNPAAVEFRGYVNPKMERLRRGIGPEDIALVDSIAPSEVPGLLREELPQLKEMWAKRRQEIEQVEAAWKKGKQLVDLQQEEESGDGGDESGAAHVADGEDEDGEGGEAVLKVKKKRGLLGGNGGEAAAWRLLRAPGRHAGSNGGGGGSGSDGGRSSLRAGEGEGAWRRLPRREARLLLQQDGGDDSGGNIEAVAPAMADHGAGLDAAGGTLVGAAVGADDEAGTAAAAATAADAAGAAVTGIEVDQQPAGAAGYAKADGADLEEEEEQEVVRQAVEREAALGGMPPIIKRSDEFVLESPRPVVAYMSRNFFSRGVLNEHDILRYILSRYNVTVRVTTFEEPLLEAMELLQHADVLIGMHGAGWTNGMFVKHGAVAMQMYPYGWRLPDNSTIRGYNYREIVLASECRYIEWVSQRWDYAFFRRIDFNKRVKMEYVLHPDPHGPHPIDGWPGNPWIYQNTYVDMQHFGPYIDEAMAAAGIKPVPNPIPVTVN